MTGAYTIHLSVCQGIVEESRILLDLWQPGMDASDLYQAALESGSFPSMTASRLRNMVKDGFARRYLSDNGGLPILLKSLEDTWSSREFAQLLFLYTSRTEGVLGDFVHEVYWPIYASGRETISNEEANVFVTRAVQQGKTSTPWPDSTIARMASNLTGTCGDFGLLERGSRRVRKIQPYRLEPRVGAYLAYDLHFTGHGDNKLVNHPDWGLFGMDSADVLAELKRLALRDLLILQTAGGVTRIDWRLKSTEELVDVLSRNQL